MEWGVGVGGGVCYSSRMQLAVPPGFLSCVAVVQIRCSNPMSASLKKVCFSLSVSAAIVSSEQNPVIIIAVVAVAGTIILVFMVFGFIIGRRYALAGPIDSPLL